MKNTILCKTYAFLLGILFSPLLVAQNQSVVFETTNMKMVIDGKGYLQGFYDKSDNVNYLASGKQVPLLSIRCDKKFELPSLMKAQGSFLVLLFEKNKIEAKVKVTNRKTYLTFELVEMSPAGKVDLIVWGPYATTIRESIGEVVGVVHNDKFSLGIQCLNMKTLGGYPTEESDVEPYFEITDTVAASRHLEEWKVSKTFRGQTAKWESWGSILQAYCRNRDRERIVSNWEHEYYVAPPFNDGGVIGSKIALFGCPPGKVLDMIGQIEITEGLPHPLIDGTWCKIAPAATSSYLILDFDESTIDEALKLTSKAGLKYLYHGGPFETWGHFKLNEKGFPDNWNSLKRCVDKAEKQGIHLGVHTLSNFITTNDPYVTPIPDKRLAKVGSSVITDNIDDKTTEIPVKSAVFFNQMKNNNLHTVVIGNELIRYKEVSTSEPYVLKECVRGAFGTKAAFHSKGDTIAKLMDHGYKTFLTNSELSEEVAGRIADLFNYTGICQTSFDGLEGNFSTGMGQYGCQLFVKTWYDKLKPEFRGKIINDASMPTHYNWHINTRYNWGEPWYAGFRESQTQYRLKNQDFFQRNFLPAMLGWFNMRPETSIEDVEWLLARAAGFNAGFSFCVSFDAVRKNGSSDAIFDAIRQWEMARMAGVFSPEQKKLMQDINNEFHLEPGKPGEWILYPFKVQRYVHEQKIRQPGEPLSSTFEFENPYDAQPAKFTLALLPGEDRSVSSVEKISMEVNYRDKVDIEVHLEPFQVLKSDGTGMLRIYDKNWNLVRTIDIAGKLPVLFHGMNTIVFNADFAEESSSRIKIEMKTRGDGEKVQCNTKSFTGKSKNEVLRPIPE